MKQSKLGFTLVELVIILAVFGILMLAGTNFFLDALRNSVQVTVRNEVRQNANLVLTKLRDSIRKSGCYKLSGLGGNSSTITLTTYSTSDCDSQSLIDTFEFNASSLEKGSVKQNTTLISSSTTSFVDCSGVPSVSSCGATECTQPGISFTSSNNTALQNGVNYTGLANITLTVQQRIGATRADQCGKIVLTTSATPRQF